MWENFKKWWNRKQIREQSFLDELSRYSAALQEERTKVETVTTELASVKEEVELFRLKDEADRLKREGKEPWIEIKSADYSEVKGIQIELDWNDAFIEYLKENGIKGQDEEATVQKWIAFLYQDLIDRLETTSINNAAAKPRVNDFE